MRVSQRCASDGFWAAAARCGVFSTVMTSLLKKSLRAAERHRADVEQARRRSIRQQGFLDTTRLVFIDETATSTNMVRLWGRCLRGERLISHVPHGHWKTITFVAALRHNRMVAPMVIDGPINGATFLLCRTVPGSDAQTQRHRGDGQPSGPQSSWRERSNRSGWRNGALSAAVLARPQ